MFSLFTIRFLATDLSQSHCNFKSHVMSPWQLLVPFSPFMQLPIPKLYSTRLEYSRLLLYTPLYSVYYCCSPFLMTPYSYSSHLGIRLTYIDATRTTHHRKHILQCGPTERACLHHFVYCCVTSPRTRERA
jgi:hypothetical protein